MNLSAPGAHRPAPRRLRGRRGFASSRLAAVCLVVLACVVVLAGCGSSSSSGGSGSSGSGGSASSSVPAKGPQKAGGSVTVLEGAPYSQELNSLDPANVHGTIIYAGYMTAIFDQLFYIGNGGKIVPGLASGYKQTDGGKTLYIHLRKGVTFSDGTPFNAAAVVWNFKMDAAEGKRGCYCVAPVLYEKGTSFKTVGSHTVVLHLPQVYAPLMYSFDQSNWNYMVSPTAYKKEGAAKFATDPVGAGPFKVASFTPGNKLVLTRNPRYWEKGHPYLNGLTFQAVQSDQAAFQAMSAGQGDVYENLVLANQVQNFRSAGFRVFQDPSSVAGGLQINTLKPPFNNIKAREVLYYATSPEAINKVMFNGAGSITQSFMPADSHFPYPKVPGYRTYDPAKAKALLKQIGGLNITLDYLSPSDEVTAQAIQSEWEAVGIKVKLVPQNTTLYLSTTSQGKFEVYINQLGGWDPGGSGGLSSHFVSSTPYSTVHDPKIDKLAAQAEVTFSQKKQAALYKKVANILSRQADVPWLFAYAHYVASKRNVQGPGVTSTIPAIGVTPIVWWQDVSAR